MTQTPLFNILDRVDSTNNYAMGKVHEGMAMHGMAWFAREQTAGKGQRGKEWLSGPGNSIILSITLQPSTIFISNPFYLSALVAVECRKYLQKVTGNTFQIKWPNDLLWRDRKTGGILIENSYAASAWKWAIVGIGINVNQTGFVNRLGRAVSLRQITGETNLQPAHMAYELWESILKAFRAAEHLSPDTLIDEYNAHLYKKDHKVKLKKDNAVFLTTVKQVNKFGQLITEDTMQRTFNFGEVEWMPGSV